MNMRPSACQGWHGQYPQGLYGVLLLIHLLLQQTTIYMIYKLSRVPREQSTTQSSLVRALKVYVVMDKRYASLLYPRHVR